MRQLKYISIILGLSLVPVLANDLPGDHHDVDGERRLLGVLDFQRRLLGMITVEEELAAYARGERPRLDDSMRPKTVKELSADPQKYPLWNAIFHPTKHQ